MRSYAMSAHNMRPEIGRQDQTMRPEWDWCGVGTESTSCWAINSTIHHQRNSRKPLALVKLSWIPDPANTLLLTELFSKRQSTGTLGTGGYRRARASKCHSGDKSLCHSGRFNYLMLDGHVELLSPLETGSCGETGNMTVRKGD